MEVFGQPGPDGKPVPFHLYSMRQAIEEHFILDVLQNYTSYKTYSGLIKAIQDDPQVDKKKAARALARFMSLHPHNIAQKVEVIIEHFRHFTCHKIGGRAKAMVVTSSRLHAVRYKLAFDKYIAAKGYAGIKSLVAFSGIVTDPDSGQDYTEVGMNKGIKESELPEKFDNDVPSAPGGRKIPDRVRPASPAYDVCGQAARRYSGSSDPLTSQPDAPRQRKTHFVLDFVNETQEILDAFQPYYELTFVGEQADP